MLLCFDFDGVIADSLEQQLAVVLEAQRNVGSGRIPVLEDFRSVHTLTPLGFAEHIGIPQSDIQARCDQLTALMSSPPSGASIFPSAVETIALLARHHTLVIITSNVRETVDTFLNDFCLMTMVRDVYDVRMPGGNDEKIRKVMETLGFTAADTVMIGDTAATFGTANMPGLELSQ